MKQRNRLAVTFIIVVACVLMQACRAYYRHVDRMMKYYELPEKVQNKFLEVYEYYPDSVCDVECWTNYNQPIFMHGYNVSGDTVIITPSVTTYLDMEKGIIVRSNGKSFRLDFVVVDGIFVIEGDTMYYPIGFETVWRPGTPRPSVVRPKRLNFGASKMSKNKFRFLKWVW